MNDDWKRDRIGSCERGENPMMLLKMKSGFAVMADNQFLPGYCILLHYPRASSLEELSLCERAQYLIDTTLIGEAIKKVCSPKVINYSTLMNLDNYLHTHIEARYEWEDEKYKHKPSWTYPENIRYNKAHEFDPKVHGELKQNLTDCLAELMDDGQYKLFGR